MNDQYNGNGPDSGVVESEAERKKREAEAAAAAAPNQANYDTHAPFVGENGANFNYGAPGSATEAINKQNLTGDPGKKYVDTGDTGGSLNGQTTIGEGRSITPEQAAAQKQAALAAGIDPAWVEDFLRKNSGDTNRIIEGYQSELKGGGSDNPVVQSWAGAGGSGSGGDANDLYAFLKQRMHQSLDVSASDPTIRTQANPFRAATERSSRDYLSGLAERGSPTTNLNAEARLASEKAGQAVGSFEAELVGRELEARRAEIQQAIDTSAGLLTADQDRELRRQMMILDNAIQQQQLALTGRGQDLQNTQFNNQLGLTAEQQAAYWDAVRRGVILG